MTTARARARLAADTATVLMRSFSMSVRAGKKRMAMAAMVGTHRMLLSRSVGNSPPGVLPTGAVWARAASWIIPSP
jgi:hypothetical protein